MAVEVDECNNCINCGQPTNQKLEKFECPDCGCYFMVADRNDFVCPNCEGTLIENSQDIKTEQNDEYSYMMLGRLKFDLDNFLSEECFSYKKENHLWALNKNEQIKEMKNLYDKVAIKPDWITMEDIEDYEKRVNEIS